MAWRHSGVAMEGDHEVAGALGEAVVDIYFVCKQYNVRTKQSKTIASKRKPFTKPYVLGNLPAHESSAHLHQKRDSTN